MNKESEDAFLAEISSSIQNNEFLKLTLSKVKKEDDLRNVYARLIELKNQLYLSFTLRYKTKDVTKNYTIEAALEMIGSWIGQRFLNAQLFSISEDVILQYNKKRKAALRKQKASLTEQPDLNHNRKKQRLIEADSGRYLQKLGLVSSKGDLISSRVSKFRQVNRYVEVLAPLCKGLKDKSPIIVDMGCGKGYLTFALFDYLNRATDVRATMIGIELREYLVDFCNQLAEESGFKDLTFKAMDIHEFQPQKLNVLIALHACDTATDEAIFKGIKSKAELIVVAPCCHKQIRTQMAAKGEFEDLMKFGILEEREAELLTDGIRALLLEVHGYKTKVFEFVSNEHTGKNLMITAELRSEPLDPEKKLNQIEQLKNRFGIKSHYLEELLENFKS